MTKTVRWSLISSFSLLFLAFSFAEGNAQTQTQNPAIEHVDLQDYFGKDGRYFLRIVGGQNAAITDYPWQVAITTASGQQYCGGSIIDEYWVVTAAHCLGGTPPHIKAGVTNRTHPGQLIAVEEMFIYPLYPGATGSEFDIALLRLTAPIDLSGPEAAAIPIVSRFHADAGLTDEGVTSIVTGWGALSEGGASSNILQMVEVPIVTNESASPFYDPIFGEGSITPDMLAAGFTEGGADACQGDSGGPLVVADPDSPLGYSLAGVVSWGYGCARPNFPGLYARVSYFSDWIEITTGLQFDGPGEPKPAGAFSLLSPSNATSLELNSNEDISLEITWEESENAGGYYWQFFLDEATSLTASRNALLNTYYEKFASSEKRSAFQPQLRVAETTAPEPMISLPSDSNGGKNYLNLDGTELFLTFVSAGMYRGQTLSGTWDVRARSNSEIRYSNEAFALSVTNTGVRPDAVPEQKFAFSTAEGFSTGSIHEQNNWIAATGGTGIGGLGIYGPANSNSPIIVNDIHNGSGQSLQFPHVATEPPNRWFYAIGPEFNVEGDGAYVVSADFRVTDDFGADYIMIIEDDETLSTLAIVIIDWLGRIIVIQENISGVAGFWEPSDDWQNITVVYNKSGVITYIYNDEVLATAPHPYPEIAQPTRLSFMSDNYHDGESGHFANLSVENEEHRHVTFMVDMRAQIAQDTFDPSSDNVYVRGGFNGWESTELLATDFPGIYAVEIYVEGDFEEELEYKFLINDQFEGEVGTGTNGNRVMELYHPGVNLVMDMAHFNNEALPERVTLRTPDDGSNNVSVSPTFRWNRADFADSYNMQISTNSDFSADLDEISEITGGGSVITYSQLLLDGSTTYYWRVRATNAFGDSEWSTVWSFTTETVTSAENEEQLPTEIVLYPNYPNPFNPTTSISYSLPQATSVNLQVFDLTGRLVATLASGMMPAGRHEVSFDASNMASGMYIYRLEAGTYIRHNKMLLVK